MLYVQETKSEIIATLHSVDSPCQYDSIPVRGTLKCDRCSWGVAI